MITCPDCKRLEPNCNCKIVLPMFPFYVYIKIWRTISPSGEKNIVPPAPESVEIYDAQRRLRNSSDWARVIRAYKFRYKISRDMDYAIYDKTGRQLFCSCD